MKKTLLTFGLFVFGLAQVDRTHAQTPGIDGMGPIIYAVPNDSLFSLQWSHKNDSNVPVFNNSGICGAKGFDLNILPAWDRLDAGKYPVSVIHVGMLDTGLDPNHPDMDQGRVLPGINFTANSYTAPSGNTNDSYGHGTHVTGAIAAKVNNRIGIAGIDRSCKVMPIVIQAACTIGDRKHIARAIRYAADHNIKVINMSWGWEEVTIDPYIRDSISYAIGRGCVFVGATGNDNTNTVDFPAKVVISVGAANPCGFKKSGIQPLSCEFDTRPEANQAHWGTNEGIGLDIMGPGTMMPAIDMQGTAGFSARTCTTTAIVCYHADATGNYIKDAYGTSIASPCISGIVSQMLSVNPTLKMHEVEYLLKASSKRTKDNLYKWPDADQAIEMAANFITGSRPLADLAVTSVQYERIGATTVRATVIVFNHSYSVGSPASSLDIYTSDNDLNNHDDNRRTGTTASIPALAPRASYTCSVTFQDPNDFYITANKKLWLNAIVDPMMSLEEIDDANNARSVEVQANQVRADLIVSGLSAVSVPGGNQVTCKIKNISNYPASFFSNNQVVRFQVSNALATGSIAIPVSVYTITTASPLTINPNQEMTYTVTLPVSKTHVIAKVDPAYSSIFPYGVVTEVSDSNNTATLDMRYINSAKPDLLSENVSYTVSAIPSGGKTVQVQSQIKNAGTFEGVLYNNHDMIHYFASNDQTLSSDDQLLGNAPASQAQVLASGDISTIFQKTLTVQRAYLLLKVDPDDMNIESNEGNNVYAISLPANNQAPDFIPNAVTYTISNGSGGKTVDVRNNIKNTGTANGTLYLYSNVVRYFDSYDQTLSSDDAVLGNFNINYITPLSPNQVSAWFSKAVTAQRSYVLVQVDPDNNNAESNEGNNVYAISLATNNPAPDFIPNAVTYTISNSPGGKTVNVRNNIKNTGTANGTLYLYSNVVRYFDSYDQTLSSDDAVLDNFNINYITPLSPNQVSAWFPKTVTAQRSYLLVKVDPDNNNIESDEGNNVYPISLQSSGMEEEEVPGGGGEDSSGVHGQAARVYKMQPQVVLPVNPEFQLELYPNPATDYVTIAVELPGSGEVMLTDLLGNGVYTYALGESGKYYLRFDTEGLSPGVYLVKLSQAAGKSLTKKLLIR